MFLKGIRQGMDNTFYGQCITNIIIITYMTRDKHLCNLSYLGTQ